MSPWTRSVALLIKHSISVPRQVEEMFTPGAAAAAGYGDGNSQDMVAEADARRATVMSPESAQMFWCI